MIYGEANSLYLINAIQSSWTVNKLIAYCFHSQLESSTINWNYCSKHSDIVHEIHDYIKANIAHLLLRIHPSMQMIHSLCSCISSLEAYCIWRIYVTSKSGVGNELMCTFMYHITSVDHNPFTSWNYIVNYNYIKM